MTRSRQDPGSATTATADPVRYSFCVPTFRRPAFLGDLIRDVVASAAEAGTPIEMIVVDNDPRQSALRVVEDAIGSATFPIVYVSEPRTNIAHARNAAITAARGDIIVFVDDDQILSAGFIVDLDRRWSVAGQDVVGILTSVRTSYEGPVPAWFADGRFFDRPLDDGSVIPPDQVRTGGLSVKRDVFTVGSDWFDPKWGSLGGEDTAFFAHGLPTGSVVIGVASPYVIERVPTDRIRFRYVLRDRFRKGMTHALVATGPLGRRGRARYLLRSIGALAAAIGLLCVAPIRGRPTVARASLLVARQGGKLYAMAGGRWSMYGA